MCKGHEYLFGTTSVPMSYLLVWMVYQVRHQYVKG